MKVHEQYMWRALELARRGVGWCSPNPAVGAVLVRDGDVVGEGYHMRAGEAHAEVNAIHDAGAKASGATLYVTLEPCNHHGRTPACTEAILDAGIKAVYVGIADPNPLIRGGGATHLSRHGLDVHIGLCEADCAELVRAFLHQVRTGNPYVIAKFGTSLDGKIATSSGESRWITGVASRRRVHDLRHEVDAIVVGVDTVIADDPELTARRSRPSKNPVPVVLDSRGRIPIDSKLVRSAGDRHLIVASTDRMPESIQQELVERGVTVLSLQADRDGRVAVQSLLRALGARMMQSVLVEGGSRVLGSFFDAELVDEVWAFVAPSIIGGQQARPAVGGNGVGSLAAAARYRRVGLELLENDILIQLRTCLQES